MRRRPVLERIRNRIRFFNKAFLNKLLGKLAGAAHGPFAMVLHRGRKSGTPYQTPIIVAPDSDGFVIALTYGPAVDWYRNILSAGKCKLRWHSREIDIGKIEAISPQEAKPALPVFEKFMLGMLRVHDFAKMWRAA
jgi:deazaflavin-dependent oxidoreductase (nitroreductase family)